MNCALALKTSVSTLENKKFKYADYPPNLTLYNDVTEYFTNPYESKCLAINNCKFLIAPDCLLDYTGHVKITKTTGFIEAQEDYGEGYVDTLCVKCCNSKDGCVEHNNWIVE